VLVVSALIATALWVLPWGLHFFHREFAKGEWEAAHKRWQNRDARDRVAWAKSHPDKLFPQSMMHGVRIARIPKPVVDAGPDQVLLDDGRVLTSDDLITLHLDQDAPLPPAPVQRRATTLLTTRGAMVFADGTFLAEPWPRRGSVKAQEDMVTRRLYFSEEVYRPRPKDGPIHALDDVVAAVGSSSGHVTLVLRRNGQVHATGKQSRFGELGPQRQGPDGVPGYVLGDAVAVAMGEAHGLALKRDGTVWSWGQEAPPYANFPESPADAYQPEPRQIALPARAIKIAAGLKSSLALLEDGTVWGWGNPECAALGVSAQTLTAEAFAPPGPSYLPESPEVRDVLLEPRRIEGPIDIVDVQASGYHAVALKRDGTLWAWGLHNQGAIGSSEYAEAKYNGMCKDVHRLNTFSLPRPVRAVSGVKQIFAALGTTVLIKDDNSLWYLGQGCRLCANLSYAAHEYLAEGWGVAAAKGMWCGRVSDVAALRKAVDAFVFARYPGFGIGEVHISAQLRLRFRSVARHAYLRGYDEQTRLLRHRAGNPSGAAFYVRSKSAQSSTWFSALDEGMHSDSWVFVPEFLRNRPYRYSTFTATLLPEDEREFKAQACEAAGHAMKVAMEEAVRERERAKAMWQADDPRDRAFGPGK
jgi:hypothetical protein